MNKPYENWNGAPGVPRCENNYAVCSVVYKCLLIKDCYKLCTVEKTMVDFSGGTIGSLVWPITKFSMALSYSMWVGFLTDYTIKIWTNAMIR